VHYGQPGDLYQVREAFIVTLNDVPRALLMMNGMLEADGPLWTLYVEFHLYVIAMFASMVVGGGLRWIYAGVAIGLLGLFAIHNTEFSFFGIVWSMGAMLSIVRQRIGSWARVPVYLLAVTFLAFAVLCPQVLAADYSDAWVARFVQLGACIIYAQLIFLEDRLLRSAPDLLVKTGEFSYSLYVIHFPLLLLMYSSTQHWMGASLARSIWVAAGSTAVALCIAYWFARFFEDQRLFKPKIKAALHAILPAARRQPLSALTADRTQQ